jgi:neutral ceramidase
MDGFRSALSALTALTLLLSVGCGDDGSSVSDDAGPVPDGGIDFGPTVPASTDHCSYVDLPATANAGGTVEEGTIEAGAAELVHDFPVGATLGAYTGRVTALGEGRTPDGRTEPTSGSFTPSIGIETRNKAKAIVLRAGGETVVILKSDVGLADAAITHRVEERLEEVHGESFAGKVLWATSHTHSGFAQYTSNTILYLGLGQKREEIATRVVEDLVTVAGLALDNLEPARVGIASNDMFDPDDQVTRDRRDANDELMGGPKKDDFLVVMRVDAMDGSPIAIATVFGIHGTVLGADNLLVSTEGPGTIERAVEENFDEPVVVMHLQGAGGDVSPAGSGGIDCDGDPCYNFARLETIGRYARDAILTTWMNAGDMLQDELAMEMVTRSVDLGPDWETFTVRDGDLEYSPWDGRTIPDLEIFDGMGNVISPLEEFNAPHGAGLCGQFGGALFPQSQMPGTRSEQGPYRSCMSIDDAAPRFTDLLDLPIGQTPSCASTRLTLSALKIGDWSFLTAPGEPVTLWAQTLRERAPAGADRTVVIGYAQDHMGYLLTVEDWLAQGYEPSINIWGPLEGEYILEKILELAPLAETPEREDAVAGFADRWLPDPVDDSDLDGIDSAPMAGTVPATPWERVYVHTGEMLTSSQPPSTLPRLESAYFSWIGEDTWVETPVVTLQRMEEGSWVDVERRSGRPVQDQDLLLTYTPDPLNPEDGESQTHHWAVEWQAVTPWGTPDLDEVEDRFGVPVGMYRFHVEAGGYSLDSDAFEVTPATMNVTASYAGGMLTGTATFHAPNGFRLLHPRMPSNQPVPANGTVTLTVDRGGATETIEATLDENGGFSVATGSGVDSVEVVDRFGNEGSASL